MLEPGGLRVTQFTLLVAVSLAGAAPITRLAEELVMDRTTLTRNLRPLEKQGLIKVGSGKDQRTRAVTLTARGRNVLAEVLPLWEKAQARVVKGLGPERWNSLLADLSATVALAR
jgi:DNA-binding MarR family transcriptional regulator